MTDNTQPNDGQEIQAHPTEATEATEETPAADAALHGYLRFDCPDCGKPIRLVIAGDKIRVSRDPE
jgi:hypothetical protein